MRFRGLLISTVIAVCCVCAAQAQQLTGAEAYVKARAFYEKGQYDSTAQLLRAFLVYGGKDAATEHLVPLLAESLVRTGDNEYLPRLLVIYEKKFPRSAFLPRLNYLNAIVLARAGKSVDAVDMYCRAIDGGLSPQLDSAALVSIGFLSDKVLGPGDIINLQRRDNLPSRVREVLGYSLVKKYYTRKQLSRAQRAAREFTAAFPSSPYVPLVERIVSSSVQEGGEQVVLGVLAPLSGFDADIGKRILQGVQLAVDEHNASASPPVKLVIADTRSSPVQTAHKTYELITEFQAPVLIGPVLSQEAAVSAAMLVDREQVMVSPTATDDGIASLGRNIFLMNVSMGVLGRAVAEYAVKNLSITEFAMMVPNSDYGRVLAENFRAEVSRLGGVVVAEEVFTEGANDFKAQFLSLRRTLFRLRKTRDSLAVASGTVLAPRTARMDTLLLADSLLSIGGLFIPAESEDVVMLAPQVAFHRIQTQLLGATGWHTTKTILDGKKYVENAIVVTTAETERTDTVWTVFKSRFYSRYGAEPDRISALGYDAGRVVCKALADVGSAFTSARFIEAMRRVQGYRGAAGTVSFDPVRNVNREAVIVKISERKFIRVK